MTPLPFDKSSTISDTKKSFIIQAPAGSGKTTLLVKRYLSLLAKVNNPEEIIAITFNRKAAAEIKLRIIELLSKPNDILARNAINQSNQKNWDILNNLHRLRIQTIDSLCYSILKKLPVLDEDRELPFWSIVESSELDNLYLKAAQDTLRSLDRSILQEEELKNILYHLNNDWQQAERLLVNLLRSRESWLPHLIGLKNTPNYRQLLESELINLIQEAIQTVMNLFPKPIFILLLEILTFIQEYSLAPPIFLNELNNPATPSIAWLSGLAEFLLTKNKKPTWRQSFTKKEGLKFKDKSQLKIAKDKINSLIKELEPNERLRDALAELADLPPERYSEPEWQITETLLKLLPLMVAHLKLIFKKNRKLDYTEIAMAASRALGTLTSPSDLALLLDYQLKHILIDEFQDTSTLHYRLFEQLTSLWQTNDNEHSIFIVGDPMQSIYRFREAEVGLFLRCKNFGIGNVKPYSVALKENFRTNSQLLNWLNDNLSRIFPKTDDITLGKIAFLPASSTKNPNLPARVTVTLFKNLDDSSDEPNDKSHLETQETAYLIKNIKELSNKAPNETIGIIARTRKHLSDLIFALKKHKLSYKIHEHLKLDKNWVIQDLFSLTKALANLNDRLSWVAVLRAPWCGLTLKDIHTIANYNSQNSIWYNLNRCHSEQLLIEHSRAASFISLMLPVVEQVRRLPWKELLTKAWLRLGGPATLNTEDELVYAEAYFELIEEQLNIDLLRQKISDLQLPPPDVNSSIQLMTIHKAKGLEFDHVIIPKVDRSTKVDEHKLLSWLEITKTNGKTELIIAPLSQTSNSVYQYLRKIDRKKASYEATRLLYVGLTRAKKSILLTGIDTQQPEAGSFLEQLRRSPNLKNLEEKSSNDTNTSSDTPHHQTDPNHYLTRLASTWQSPVEISLPPTIE